MKKIIPILILSSFALTGCNLVKDKISNLFGGGSKKESDKTLLGAAVEFMNAYNYRMDYSVEVNYDVPEEYKDYVQNTVLGPYHYDIDFPRVYVSGSGTDDYFNIKNGDYQNVTHYYKDSDGNYQTNTVDLTTESNQVKYFDQATHSESDYKEVKTGVYEMVDEKLEYYGFERLTLQVIGQIRHPKVVIDSYMSQASPETAFTVNTHLHAELYQFGDVTVTLPDVY